MLMSELKIEKLTPYEQGIELGIAMGRAKCSVTVAKAMLLRNFDLSTIAELTGLSIEQIQALSESLPAAEVTEAVIDALDEFV